MIFNAPLFYRELLVSKESRSKYKIEGSLFNALGDLIISDLRQARLVAKRINDVRIQENRTKEVVSAGHLNALGLLHEIFHFLIKYYEKEVNPGSFYRAVNFLKQKISSDELDKSLMLFVDQFPPQQVINGIKSPNEFINSYTNHKSNREILLEEIILLYFQNINPSAKNFSDLFSDDSLVKGSKYKSIIESLNIFFDKEKPIGHENLSLITFLKKPIEISPNNIEAQLDFIKEKWVIYLGEDFTNRILIGKDLMFEDYKFFNQHGEFTKSTPDLPDFKYDKDLFESIKQKLARGESLSDWEKQFYYAETEQFTYDIEWMPNVVMLAKNVFVWLFQLSQQYGREIKRLNEIPDEELDKLSRRRITALWLIGLWERSTASRKIKQIMGNPEAASSAYSLFDYNIAGELGGDEAFENLKYRAEQRGIRMASDMVPNHTGIFSQWIIDKPHYFIQTSNPPYPSYSFNSVNLSDDNRVEVKIEDKYFSKSDAAVVFQRRDNYSGDVKYIYHGNDGTHMPWNDTAQLNLLNPEVREALIQTIMHVARKTPIIRFDAAMTLTKKHYQRLWFPVPGTGADIPSRSDYAMTRQQFDEQMPNEFWREVVDRINAEMPETLLLAEAFWLMESFFVRTLGMHRVYNSAFMHMMMKEENEKYKILIKNTLSFNPEILKRYVNFMSNPDEETSVNQFGKGDKYFGVAMLMLTLPGLPMIAHGQVEGFAEKYGMEYKRSYYTEFIDDNLVRRHEEELFPLLEKRYLFSQVYNFEFYDLVDDNGIVNHNVFAFSNRVHNEKAIVVYNNAYAPAVGRINYSSEKQREGSLITSKLSESLGIKSGSKYFYVLYDHKSKNEFLVTGKELSNQGLFVILGGYQYHVFTGFREIYDELGDYEYLYSILNGKGVPSVEYAIKELMLVAVHNAINQIYNPDTFVELKKNCFIEFKDDEIDEGLPLPALKSIDNLLKQLGYKNLLKHSDLATFSLIKEELLFFKSYNEIIKFYEIGTKDPEWLKTLKKCLTPISGDNTYHIFSILLPAFLFDSKLFVKGYDPFKELMLYRNLYENFERIGNSYELIDRDIKLIQILLSSVRHDIIKVVGFTNIKSSQNKYSKDLIEFLFSFDLIKQFVGYNEYEGVIYFNKENFDYLINWLFYLVSLEILKKEIDEGIKIKKNLNAEVLSVEKHFFKKIKQTYPIFFALKIAASETNYKYIEFSKFFDVKPIAKEELKSTKKETKQKLSKVKVTKKKKDE